MNNPGLYILVGGLVIGFLTPILVAFVIRLIFRKVNESILAMAMVFPLATLLLIKLVSGTHWNEHASANTIFLISISILIYYGIPYFLVKAGIAIGDKIIKRNATQASDPTRTTLAD